MSLVVPKERYQVTKPAFYAAAQKDTVCIPSLGKQLTSQLCTNTTIKEFDVGHWMMFENSKKLNKELLAWISGL